MQDVSTRRYLSTAEYNTLYSAVDKDLRVETSCITIFELLLCVLLGSNFHISTLEISSRSD